MHETTARGSRPRGVLILVENLPSPFDRRVWEEATTLGGAGEVVSIICPTGKGYERKFEAIDGIHIYRYHLPVEASGAAGYAVEYAIALAWTFALAWRVLLTRGFDVMHACNPPDLFFLIGACFKLLGKKFVFDHHDLNPELYEAKFFPSSLKHAPIRKNRSGGLQACMTSNPRVRSTRQASAKVQASAIAYSTA